MSKANRKVDAPKVRLVTGKAAKPAADRSLEPGFVGDIWSAICAATPEELRDINARLDEAAKRDQEQPRVVAGSDGMTIRGSAQKLNLVAGLIRSKKAGDALNLLTFSKKAVAVDARKVLVAAIATAQNNHNLNVDALVVTEASVGKSLVKKRSASRGRGNAGRNAFSKLRIVVREENNEAHDLG